jgi:hypothetical protein
LYSSLLTTWRRERDAGVLQALAPQKRGPKSKRDPVAEENQQLHRETQRLTEGLWCNLSIECNVISLALSV